MAKVKKNGLMVQNLKVLIKMVKKMERVYFNGVMAVIMMGNSMKMKFKVKENINGQIKDHMIGCIIKCKDLENLSGRMVECMKEIILKIGKGK